MVNGEHFFGWRALLLSVLTGFRSRIRRGHSCPPKQILGAEIEDPRVDNFELVAIIEQTTKLDLRTATSRFVLQSIQVFLPPRRVRNYWQLLTELRLG